VILFDANHLIDGNPSCPNHYAIVIADPHFLSFTSPNDKFDLFFKEDGYYNLNIEKNHCLIFNMYVVSYYIKGHGLQFIDALFIQYSNDVWNQQKENSLK